MSDLPANRTPEQIRSNIEATRKELAFSVNDLRSKVAELTNWRSSWPTTARPALAGAAVAGFVIGGGVAATVLAASAGAAGARLGAGSGPPGAPAAASGGSSLGIASARGWMPRTSRYSRTAIWIVAATGTATIAPRTPSSVPPNSTATMTRNGLICTARFWICGWTRLFSTCW